MQIEFTHPNSASNPTQATALLVFEDRRLSIGAKAADTSSEGAVVRALRSSAFSGRPGDTLTIVAPPVSDANCYVLLGVGPERDLNSRTLEEAGARAYRAVSCSGASALALEFSDLSAELSAQALFGALLAAYRFDRYRTKEKAESKPTVSTIRLVCDAPEKAHAAFGRLQALAEGIYLARDLTSEPPNVLYPAEFAKRLRQLGALGLKVEVLGEAEMTSAGMGALLGVGQGSPRESQLVVLEWRGGGDEAPVAFLGKGVCFDSGGISLKKPENMESMKWDMAGAAAVSGLMRVLATRKARVNAVAILGLVENMPDGGALRPGDIVTSMSGQTVEIISTDAEGRLVLCDALWYCQKRFQPRLMVDLATLTGAVEVALGDQCAGLFANDETVAEALMRASRSEPEMLWRLPIIEDYEVDIASLAADMKNFPKTPAAGAIVGALFLRRFIQSTPWAHLDIAGVAWKKESRTPTIPDGATGFGVRLLNRFVEEFCEGIASSPLAD
jgi:leucyl aminopeptidase